MVTITTFKGNNVIQLYRNEEDKYPFSFGAAKAALILRHIEEIKKFVEENRKEETE